MEETSTPRVKSSVTTVHGLFVQGLLLTSPGMRVETVYRPPVYKQNPELKGIDILPVCLGMYREKKTLVSGDMIV